LAIARHLIELHGGTITAESEGDNCGATFTVQLPSWDAGLIEIRPAPQGGVTADARSLAGLRVLVVDDSHEAVAPIAMVLLGAGALVESTTSVAQARARLQAFSPDLLIADIEMPGTEGYALIREIRQAEAHTGAARLLAIALAARALDEDRARAREAGFDFHLTKPLDPVLLINVVGGLRQVPPSPVTGA
jgi:CheY-like chemotaxis protein